MAAVRRADIIRESLENDILTGGVDFGSRLDEQALARRFEVSRTPVREALNRLASAGLVDLIPNRGAFVRRVSVADLVQMFELMAEIEAAAGRLAARRATGPALAAVAAALDRCDAAAQDGDPNRYYLENSRFHEAIYDASGNGHLAAEARRLHQRLTAYRRLQLRVPKRIGQSLAEHRAIHEAIAEGDESGAAERLRDHVTIQGERFADFVASISADLPAGETAPGIRLTSSR